ncbi:hypothetical protein RJT34_10571 [Clitoria ternatea]|uniref:Uncharacterized protein n=1 Tax=Clitoria ternatea TaxID=43366 RepID=A0AAN9K934_CLITE
MPRENYLHCTTWSIFLEVLFCGITLLCNFVAEAVVPNLKLNTVLEVEFQGVKKTLHHASVGTPRPVASKLAADTPLLIGQFYKWLKWYSSMVY